MCKDFKFILEDKLDTSSKGIKIVKKMHPIIFKYSIKLRRHHQVLFGTKMLALHNTLQRAL